jgi:hypothetical protein
MSFLCKVYRHCEGVLALRLTLAPHASAGEQSPTRQIGLLRREEHPPRNDGSAGILVIMAFMFGR